MLHFSPWKSKIITFLLGCISLRFLLVVYLFAYAFVYWSIYFFRKEKIWFKYKYFTYRKHVTSHAIRSCEVDMHNRIWCIYFYFYFRNETCRLCGIGTQNGRYGGTRCDTSRENDGYKLVKLSNNAD